MVHQHNFLPVWDYSAERGPSQWPKIFTLGEKQSPIDIRTDTVNRSSELRPVQIIDPSVELVARNSGTTVLFEPARQEHNELPKLQFNGVDYVLLQLHLHWGEDDHHGSEHTVDGVQFGAELHVVFWNISKYSSSSEAMQGDDGLLVLGTLLEVQHVVQENDEWRTTMEGHNLVPYCGDTFRLGRLIDITKLMPASMDQYWTYHGSLTTPPCTECVTWVVFMTTVQLPSESVGRLRYMMGCKRSDAPPPEDSQGCCSPPQVSVKRNFRPTQPLHGRTVSAPS